MKPNKQTIAFLKNKYPKLKLGYDNEDGVIWSSVNGDAIRWDDELKSWMRSCLTKLWFTEYCKKIK